MYIILYAGLGALLLLGRAYLSNTNFAGGTVSDWDRVLAILTLCVVAYHLRVIQKIYSTPNDFTQYVYKMALLDTVLFAFLLFSTIPSYSLYNIGIELFTLLLNILVNPIPPGPLGIAVLNYYNDRLTQQS